MSYQLAALLHDEDDRIVLSTSYVNAAGEKKWFNRFVSSCSRADEVAAEYAQDGRNAHCKHGTHDGFEKSKGVPLCTTSHFTGSRTFIIDIDVGHGSGYSTYKAAADAFGVAHKSFRRLGLPKPNLYQQTGGGLQAVWVVEDILPSADWRRVNNLFLQLGRDAGLKLDTGLKSIHMAVRYCGEEFRNVNHGAPRRTEVLWFNPVRHDNATFVGIIDRQGPRIVPDGSTEPAARPRRFNERFKIQGQDEFKLDLNTVIDDCVVLREGITTGGKDHGYLHWQNLLCLSAKNGDENFGRLLAHELSKGHPDYDADEVDGKFDGFRAGNNPKPVLCSTFYETRPDLCTQCAYYKQFNSVAGIQGLKARQARAQPQAPGQETVVFSDDKILDGEYYNTDTGVRRRKGQGEEIDPLIWPKVNITNVELRSLDTSRQEQVLGFTIASNTKSWMHAVEVGVSQLVTSSVAAKVLSEQQVVLSERFHKPAQSAMVSWVENIRNRAEHKIKYTRLGWSSDMRKFVLGGSVYHDDGVIEPIPNPDLEMQAFNRSGEYDDYQHILNTTFQQEERPEAHAFLAGSLAAPLIKLSGSTGLALNFYSTRSGYGKTTLSQIAGSIYGSPRNMTFTLDDTENSIMRRVSVLNNLPGLHDEMRVDVNTQEKVTNLLFRLSSGNEKSRMLPGGKLEDRGAWRTMMLFSTNYTFTDIVRSDRKRGGEAAVARVLDFYLSPLPVGAQARAADVTIQTTRLETCNGWVGHDWIQYVVLHQKELLEKIQRSFGILMKAAHKDSTEVFARNHCFAGAAMITAAGAASKAGILPVVPELVIEAVTTSIRNARVARAETRISHDPINALRQFIRAHEANRIVVIHDGRKGVIIDTEHFLVKPPIVYELNLPEQKLYIDATAFEEWLHKSGYVVRPVLDEMRKYRLAKPRALGEGTKLRGPAIPLYALPPIGAFKQMFQL